MVTPISLHKFIVRLWNRKSVVTYKDLTDRKDRLLSVSLAVTLVWAQKLDLISEQKD